MKAYIIEKHVNRLLKTRHVHFGESNFRDQREVSGHSECVARMDMGYYRIGTRCFDLSSLIHDAAEDHAISLR